MSYKRITVPVGTILAWSGGYFTGSGNSGFTNALGNTVAAVNSLLNKSGYYVCDGSALNLPTSPIFNGAGRHLPNLTDNRFLQGSTSAGTIGGQNSVTLIEANLPLHSHTINHDHASFTTASGGAHSHAISDPGHFHSINAVSGSFTSLQAGSNSNGSNNDAPVTITNPTGITVTSTNSSHTHDIDIPNFVGNSGQGNGNATSYENRPIYLNCFYVIRVN
jgi:microcystin-dependent protein